MILRTVLLLFIAACGADPVPSDLTFTGGYQDRDTATAFLGIGGATVTVPRAS